MLKSLRTITSEQMLETQWMIAFPIDSSKESSLIIKVRFVEMRRKMVTWNLSQGEVYYYNKGDLERRYMLYVAK